jgi:NitT/TauT family transport system ATP-binding protein
MSPDMRNCLEIDSVDFSYENRGAALHAVSLQLAEGEFHCLIGRSGCGKTTLLKLAAGLLKPQRGHVLFQGTGVSQPRPEMGFVFQSPTLLPWLHVLDNVLLPLALHGDVTAADRDHARRLLGQTGLHGFEARSPTTLSGGQQSRVAIARALVTNPGLLLMDEPFAALDAITRAELQQDLLKLCQSQSTSVLFVTHDIDEAVYLGDRVQVLAQGRIVHQMNVNLPRQRQAALRDTAAFNAHCAELRQAMETPA